MKQFPLRRGTALLLIVAMAALSGCAVGPDYERPSAPVPTAYKEAPAAEAGWLPAAPADAMERGAWWRDFDDAGLNALMPQVEVSNQNVAAAVAAYAQARALVRQQRATLFPSVTLDGAVRRSDTTNSAQIGLGASWAPDLWGALARGVEGAQARAQASRAQLAAARLSAQGELATNYFSLREADAEIALLRATLEGFERTLTITRNRYAAGMAARTDVLQAQTQLANTRASLAGLRGDRAQLEHAIAVLVGRAPAELALAPAAWTPNVPEVPAGVPSTLLQRRPDIAAAERAVAAANAQIGIARAAYFPDLALSASIGGAASSVARLFSAPSSLWSLGVSVAQTLFDAGATQARVEGAQAGRDLAVANYRQTVLGAFRSVEDQLALGRALAEQSELRRVASEAADLTETQLLNRYKQGLVGYTEVVTAQTAALDARRALARLVASRQASAIALIQALGGGWQDMNADANLEEAPTGRGASIGKP
jgi:NodT family efflux transporter outer membrane factor (OMF) lipoprotein